MNILFVESHNKNPFDVKCGSVQRSNLIIQACAEISNMDVVIFSNNLELSKNVNNCNIIQLSEYINTHKSKKICEYWNKYIRSIWKNEAFFSLVNKELEKKLDEIINTGKYDKIIIRYLPDAIKCGLIKYGDKLIVDIDDSPVSISRNKYNMTSYSIKKLFRYYTYKSSKKKLEQTLKKIGVAYFSNMDELIGDKSIFLPNIPFYDSCLPVCDYSLTKYKILFVGLLTYNANIKGLNRFFKNIFPVIKNAIPEAEVHIIGKCNPEELPEWKNFNNVYVKGFIEDIEKEYKDCRVVIAPIYEGAGTNIKVLEAMQMKRPCVTTQKGVRGFCNIFKDGEDLYVSDTDEEFSNSVISILKDENLNHRIAEKAFTKLSFNFSKAVFFKIVQSSLLHHK